MGIALWISKQMDGSQGDAESGSLLYQLIKWKYIPWRREKSTISFTFYLNEKEKKTGFIFSFLP